MDYRISHDDLEQTVNDLYDSWLASSDKMRCGKRIKKRLEQIRDLISFDSNIFLPPGEDLDQWERDKTEKRDKLVDSIQEKISAIDRHLSM